MTKAIEDAVEERSEIASSEDFMAILAEDTEQYPLGNGKYALLRSLTFPEVQGLVKEYKGREASMAFGALKLGMQSPVLSKEQWDVAEKGKAGPLFKLGKRVMQLAGMMDDEQFQGEVGASS